jgi:hypothetical protein
MSQSGSIFLPVVSGMVKERESSGAIYGKQFEMR